MSLPDFLASAVEKTHFPKISRSRYGVTSEDDPVYNCVTWGFGDSSKDRWIDHTGAKGTWWPTTVPKGSKIEAYAALFQKVRKFQEVHVKQERKWNGENRDFWRYEPKLLARRQAASLRELDQQTW